MRKNARKGSRLEEDGGDYRYSEGSFNAHTRGEEKERAGKREGDRETGVRLMSFAQTVRREANVIYEDRATSQVDEVSRLENF